MTGRVRAAFDWLLRTPFRNVAATIGLVLIAVDTLGLAETASTGIAFLLYGVGSALYDIASATERAADRPAAVTIHMPPA